MKIIEMGPKSLLLALSFAVSALAARAPGTIPRFSKQLAGPINVRIKALHTISDSKALLADARVQRAAIRTLNESSNDPNWEALEETENYEDYYDYALFPTVQKIATDHDNPEAWRALISGNYNDGPEFSKWLAGQPKALPFLFELASPPAKSWVRSPRALYAGGVAGQLRADAIREELCGFRREARGHSRFSSQSALQGNQVERLAAVFGLGLCGEGQDVNLLEHAPVPSDFVDPAHDIPIWRKFTRESQQQVKSRLEKQ